MRIHALFFAYIDPGAGSLFIQALIAALISVPFVFRNSVRRMASRVRSMLGRDHDVGASHDSSQYPG